MDKVKTFLGKGIDVLVGFAFGGVILLYALFAGTWKFVFAKEGEEGAEEPSKEVAEETVASLAEMDVPALQKIVDTEKVETRAKTAQGLVKAIEAHRAKNTRQAKKSGWWKFVSESWSQAVATPGKIRIGIGGFLVLIFKYRKSDSVPFVVFWALVTFLVARGFVGNPFAVDAWIDLGKNPWDIAGMALALIAIIMLTAYALRTVVAISESWRRAALVASWVMSIAMILAIFLYYGVSAGVENDSISSSPSPVAQEAVVVTVTSAPRPTPTPTVMPARKPSSDRPRTSNVVPSETRVFGGDYHVKLNGRNTNGKQVVMVSPGQSMRVTHTEDAVSTWQPSTGGGEYRQYPLWGSVEGYSPDAWSWTDNYRYSGLAFRGVMPQEILVILGDVGSGNEDIFQFPDGTNSVTVENKTDTPQVLTLYYHGIDYYYLGNSGNCLDQEGPYVYPSISAAACSSVKVMRINGWGDQGLDGSVARFIVEMLD